LLSSDPDLWTTDCPSIVVLRPDTSLSTTTPSRGANSSCSAAAMFSDAANADCQGQTVIWQAYWLLIRIAAKT